MLCIMAGMDQKDSGALIVVSCSDMCKARIAGFSPRYVFPLVVGRPAGRSVWARRTIMQLAGFLLVMIHLALCSLLFRQARMLGIMAGMNQKGFFKVVPRPIPMVFAAQADHGDSVVAVPQVVHLPVVAQRQFPMVQTVRRTRNISSVADYGDRRPCCAGRAGFHPGRGAEVFFPWSRLLSDHRVSPIRGG